MKGPDPQVDYEYRLAQLELYEAERHHMVHQLLDPDLALSSDVWDIPDAVEA